MADVNQAGPISPTTPGGVAARSSSPSTRTGAFANRSVSVGTTASSDAVSQRSGPAGGVLNANTSQRRTLVSRIASAVTSAFGMSRRAPAADGDRPRQQFPDEPRSEPVRGGAGRDAPPGRTTDPLTRPATTSESPRGTVGGEESPVLGPANRFGEFAAALIERGNLPPNVTEDLKTSVGFAEQLDRDIVRACDLLDASEDKPLTDTERRELTSLLGANKHNLALLQTWLGDREAQLHAGDGLGAEARTLFGALHTRFADRHMELADVMSRYELDEVLDEPVSRADRAGVNLLYAEAAIRVANDLSAPGLDPSTRRRLVEDLEEHRDLLARIQAVSSGRIEAPSDELRLASKQLWDAPLPLAEPEEGGSGDIRSLRAGWNRKAEGRSHEPWLPVAHQRVGPARMLRELMQYRLEKAGVPKSRMPDLESALFESFNRVVNDQPWEAISKRVRTTVPDTGKESVVVESRIVPGKALAAHFAEDYASNGICSTDRMQYEHVPNLALTTLTNEKGKTLFSGLRHGVIDAYDIDGKRLARLPDAELRTMVGDLLVREGVVETGSEGRERTIDDLVTQIRSNPARATEFAETMRVLASRNMAREMAAAALVSNPEKFEKALAGETVDIGLSSTSLLTPDVLRHVTGMNTRDERKMLSHQKAAFAELARGGAVELDVRDHEGRPRTVTANVSVRQFNFGVNAGAVQGLRLGSATLVPSRAPGVRNLVGWGFAMTDNDPNLRKLLGPPGSGWLEGDVAARAHTMLERARELNDGRLNDLDGELARAEPGSPNAVAAERERAAVTEQIATLEKNARTLIQAARDVKTIWESKDYRRGGGDPFKMVSRLVLVSHLMGETPLFNCKSGKDRTGQLDAEVKFLATVADERDGRLPHVDREMERWRSTRGDFTLSSGNLEMQRLNTGLPGYRLKGVAGLKNMIAEGMKPVYRGGSSYVYA